MAHTYTNILVHVICSTKDRQPLLTPELRSRVFAYIGGITREMGCVTMAIDGPADHVHALLGVCATVCVADLLRTVKTNSSRWIHEQWPQRNAFAWQAGYGAFSVSQSAVEDVKAYIAKQEEHHRTMSFQEEYLAFLRRHGIKYDERYVWE